MGCYFCLDLDSFMVKFLISSLYFGGSFLYCLIRSCLCIIQLSLKCDFSGDVLDGVEKSEGHIRDAKILWEMRKDYNVFKSQMGMD